MLHKQNDRDLHRSIYDIVPNIYGYLNIQFRVHLWPFKCWTVKFTKMRLHLHWLQWFTLQIFESGIYWNIHIICHLTVQDHTFHYHGNLILLRAYFTSLTATIWFHSKLNQRNTDVLIGPLRSIEGRKGRLEVTKVAMETVLWRVV